MSEALRAQQLAGESITTEETEDPLDRLIDDLRLQIQVAPEGTSMSALQAQLEALERHRDARRASEVEPDQGDDDAES